MPPNRTFDVPPQLALAAATLVTTLVLIISLFTLPVGFSVRVAAVGVGTAAQFVVSYVSLYRPYSKLRYDHRAELLGVIFEGLRREYEALTDGEADVRMNVMPVKRQFGQGLLPRRDSFLEIEFHTDGYDREELEQRYKPGEGCCGQAYVENNPTYYDERRQPLGEGRMSATQRRVTEDVKSVLTVPVYRPGKVDEEIIGVLNLDSTAYIDETKFNEKAVQRLVMRRAALVGHVLA